MFSFIFHLKAHLAINSEWNKKKDQKPQAMWGRLPLTAERSAGRCTTRANDDVKLSRAAQHPMSKDTRSISPQHFSPHVSPVNKVLISLHAALMFYFLFFFIHEESFASVHVYSRIPRGFSVMPTRFSRAKLRCRERLGTIWTVSKRQHGGVEVLKIVSELFYQNEQTIIESDQ